MAFATGTMSDRLMESRHENVASASVRRFLQKICSIVDRAPSNKSTVQLRIRKICQFAKFANSHQCIHSQKTQQSRRLSFKIPNRWIRTHLDPPLKTSQTIHFPATRLPITYHDTMNESQTVPRSGSSCISLNPSVQAAREIACRTLWTAPRKAGSKRERWDRHLLCGLHCI
jgi:hypothetical protein